MAQLRVVTVATHVALSPLIGPAGTVWLRVGDLFVLTGDVQHFGGHIFARILSPRHGDCWIGSRALTDATVAA
jgi:hypothetical protein